MAPLAESAGWCSARDCGFFRVCRPKTGLLLRC